jgi:hypothetical protein
MTAGAAVRESLLLRKILSIMRRDKIELNINSDSLSSLALLEKPITCVRTKHMDIIILLETV